jgi:hypothetical protein
MSLPNDATLRNRRKLKRSLCNIHRNLLLVDERKSFPYEFSSLFKHMKLHAFFKYLNFSARIPAIVNTLAAFIFKTRNL